MELEDHLTIETPEGVALDLTLAGIGSRFTASLIDHTIQGVLVLSGVLLLLGPGGAVIDSFGAGSDEGGEGGVLAGAIVTLYGFLVVFLYDVLFEVRGGGRTPGKRWIGLRVVRTSGRPVGFVTSAIRNVMRLIDIMPGFYGVAMAVIFGTKRNQRLGDLAAGTVVVRERHGDRVSKRARRRAQEAAAAAAGAGDGERAAPRAAPEGWDVSAVGPAEVAAVRQFLERRETFDPWARRDLARDFADRLRPRVAGAPADMEPEPFLEALSAAKAAREDDGPGAAPG